MRAGMRLILLNLLLNHSIPFLPVGSTWPWIIAKMLWSERKKNEEMDLKKRPALLFDFVWIFKENANQAFQIYTKRCSIGAAKFFSRSLLLHSCVLLFANVVYQMYTLHASMGNMGCKHDREQQRATSGCCLNLWFSVMWSWKFRLYVYVCIVRELASVLWIRKCFARPQGIHTKTAARCTENMAFEQTATAKYTCEKL